ncbi:transcriptional regulator [Colletotrichum truncatum]|uniref:Transcriptional regulator n=1 Tax=Colletotrichum truncatum TaxID=5467 RepID=A0ACC3Z6J3_COLTU|nr:transcriptional regulator [Colletotrichum truncatum]KAF6788013.1 transcriptional regulator [Colletotrichum truncatum]
MAPSDEKLETELLNAVRDIWKSDREQLTVNFIRKRVEDDLDLEDGFFSSGKWKDKSKKLIKELAAELLENNTAPEAKSSPAPEDAKPTKSGKRQSTEASPPSKRRKRTSGAKDANIEDEESQNEKSKPKKAAGRKKSRATVDSEDELSPAKAKPVKSRSGRADKVENSDSDALTTPPESEDEKDDNEEEISQDKEAKPSSKASVTKEKPAAESHKADESSKKDAESANEKKTEQAALDDTSSELSDVIDEPPKPKRKKKETGKAPKASKQKKAPATSDNPDDAEIKKLQSQLVKCGVRKIWGFELKQYGDNSKAKIKHLKDMLNDIGMDGRFSEAKAREIKERRELEADLEAVQEMNANWGAGGRASRSKARGQPAQVQKDDAAEEEKGDEEDDDEDEEDAVVSSRARGKARADLAFLGDDDEESD